MPSRGIGRLPIAGEAPSGGAQWLGRVWDASGSIVVPAKAGWVTARCLGAGGRTPTASYYGGGGGLAKAGFPCTASDALVASVGADSTSATVPTTTTVKKNNVVLVSANSGLQASSSAPGAPGSGTIGDILRTGSAANSSTPGAPANDTGDFDMAGIGYFGRFVPGGYNDQGTYPAYRGSGAGGLTNGTINYGGGGLIVLDFWTAKPFTYSGS